MLSLYHAMFYLGGKALLWLVLMVPAAALLIVSFLYTVLGGPKNS